MFGYVNVLKAAADASWTREEVLTNNIANVDTPNYKRQDVDDYIYCPSIAEHSVLLRVGTLPFIPIGDRLQSGAFGRR